MQSPIHQIFEKLNEFSTTMKLRREAYLHASHLTNFPSRERDKFQHCVEDSADSIQFMEERLVDISDNVRDLGNGPRMPLTCSLYYGIAKSTSNLMTVYLSLQLGDVWFLKKFEEYYNSLDFNQFRSFKDESNQYMDCLKTGIQLLSSPISRA